LSDALFTRGQVNVVRLVWMLVALVLALMTITPLLYMVSIGFKTPAEMFQPNLWPKAPTLGNYVYVLTQVPFVRYLINTFVISAVVTVVALWFHSMAGYALARLRFPGRETIFVLIFSTFLVSLPVIIVPLFILVRAMGMLNSYAGIIVPSIFNAFGIFLLRQTFKTIPRELEEAARVEGANGWQILLKVYVPLARPTYIAYGLVSVSYHWNNFLWPLIITNSVNTRPLTVGLQVFSSSDQGIDWSVITAATLLSAAPLLIAFLLFQRQFVQSFLRAGIR